MLADYRLLLQLRCQTSHVQNGGTITCFLNEGYAMLLRIGENHVIEQPSRILHTYAYVYTCMSEGDVGEAWKTSQRGEHESSPSTQPRSVQAHQAWRKHQLIDYLIAQTHLILHRQNHLWAIANRKCASHRVTHLWVGRPCLAAGSNLAQQ